MSCYQPLLSRLVALIRYPDTSVLIITTFYNILVGIFRSCDTMSKQMTSSQQSSRPLRSNSSAASDKDSLRLFQKCSALNPNLCELCKTCIGDVITGGCFRDLTKQSRWTMRQTSIHNGAAEMTFELYEHPSQIEASGKEGCDLCSLFSRGPWQHMGRKSSDPSQIYVTVTHPDTDPRHASASTYRTIKSTQREPWAFQLWGETANIAQKLLPYSRTDYVPERLPTKEEWFLSPSNSRKAYECIKSWLSCCTRNHTLCMRREPRLPTRVIDIGPPDGSQNPFLFESNGKITPYVALSYCWGLQQMFITVTETLEARKAGFALTDLAKTQHDAVLLARKLDVRYLWVDALCIIQGDSVD